MVLLFILFLSVLFNNASGYHPVFCSDLSTSVISIELLDAELYLLGTRWDTVEMLVSQKAATVFKNVLSEFCLSEDSRSLPCYSKMRQAFMKELSGFAQSLGDAQPVPKGDEFITYWDKTNCSWTPEMRKLFVASCLSVCWAAHVANETEKYNQMCPNPCKTQDICSYGNCQRLGIFEHQFKCDCPKRERWDYETHTCISEGLYNLRNKTTMEEEEETEPVVCGCDPQGTDHCAFDASKAKPVCYCKPQYTGELCNEPVNACHQRIQHPYLINGGLLAAGDRACNVNQEGNSCFSFISNEGDVFYKCKCDGRKWGPDPKLPYDNCLKRRSQCDSIVCIHGKCVSNERGTQPKCICKPGYSGEICSEWIGEWSEWSPWDKCRPACGDLRYAVRSRDCLTMREDAAVKRECIGAPIEYARCAEHPCARTEGTFVNTYFAIRQNAIASSLSTAAVVCALLTVIWALFFWRTVSRPLLAIIVKLTRQRSAPG